MNIAVIKNSKFEIKTGTKTVWQKTDLDIKDDLILTEDQVKTRLIDSMKFFRNLGGYEKVKYEYTCCGYMPYEMISKSPCKTIKKIRTFEWHYCTLFYGKNKTWLIDKKSKLIFGHRLKSGETIVYDKPKKFSATLKKEMK